MKLISLKIGLCWWGLIALGLGLQGCGPRELRELERYHAHAQEVLKPRLRNYVKALEKASHHQRTQLKQALERRVLPALSRYVDALQQLRPKTQALHTAHTQLTLAYQRWLESLERFTRGLTSASKWVQGSFILQREAARIVRAERDYHVALAAIVQRLQPKDPLRKWQTSQRTKP